MEWRDEGIVIGVRRHGEGSAVLEALTREHGRHLGLVRGANSPKLRASLQSGNTLGLVWRARLEDHLGLYQTEPLNLRAGRLMGEARALAGLGYISALLRLAPERDPHLVLFEAAEKTLAALETPAAAGELARFELLALSESGFPLDLETCAATGARENLIYVSPRSGRAVSLEAGAPWRDRLLPLPAFLRDDALRASDAEALAAFEMTGYFLLRDVFAPRGLPLPDPRRAFLATLKGG